MATQDDIDQLLEGYADKAREQIQNVRKSVFRGMPIAQERVDLGQKALIYGLDSLGSSLCIVSLGSDGIVITFPSGALLDDPQGILSRTVGFEGLASQAMTISLTWEDEPLSDGFERLISQAFVMNAG